MHLVRGYTVSLCKAVLGWSVALSTLSHYMVYFRHNVWLRVRYPLHSTQYFPGLITGMHQHVLASASEDKWLIQVRQRSVSMPLQQTDDRKWAVTKDRKHTWLHKRDALNSEPRKMPAVVMPAQSLTSSSRWKGEKWNVWSPRSIDLFVVLFAWLRGMRWSGLNDTRRIQCRAWWRALIEKDLIDA